MPEALTGDKLWRVKAYRLAFFASEAGWCHVSRLRGDARTISVSNQLWRTLGSIRANLAEGYSRSSGWDRARFFEYALGSAREAREWYHCGRQILGVEESTAALDSLTEIVRLILTALPFERQRRIGR